MGLMLKLKSAPFIFILSAFLLGIYFSWLPVWMVIPLYIISLLLFVFWRRNVYVFAAIVLCFLGYVNTEIRRDGIDDNYRTAFALNDSRILVTGLVDQIVERENGYRFRLSNPLVKFDTISIDFPSILLFAETNQDISVGMKVTTEGQYFQIRGPRNPGEFDFKSFYGRKGIFGRIYTDETDIITIESFDITKIQTVQQWIRKVFKEKVGEPFGLLTALILGDKTSVDPEIREDFTNTGVIHVLAVSGLHVG